MSEIDDDAIDEAQERAYQAALVTSPFNPAKNPYRFDDPLYEVWQDAYANHLYREWG